MRAFRILLLLSLPGKEGGLESHKEQNYRFFFFKCSCFRHCLSLNCSESFFFIWSAYKFVRYELQTNGEDLGAGTLD